MALIRGHHSFDDHFTQIPNFWLRDNRLTLEARGLLAQIMSHRPGWRLSIKSLAVQNHIGRDKVKRIIDELMKLGYLERSEKQEHDENGHLSGYSYTTKDPVVGVTQEPYKAEPDKVSEPPKNTITKKTITRKNKRREFTSLPDDFEPNPSVYDDPRWLTVDVDREVERFRNWALANDKEFKDWQAALRNWLDRSIDYQRGRVYKETERDAEKRRLDEWLASQMEDDSE